MCVYLHLVACMGRIVLSVNRRLHSKVTESYGSYTGNVQRVRAEWVLTEKLSYFPKPQTHKPCYPQDGTPNPKLIPVNQPNKNTLYPCAQCANWIISFCTVILTIILNSEQQQKQQQSNIIIIFNNK